MKSIRIFNYIKYLDYLNSCRASSLGGHGFLAKLAKSANCQNAFISQVFSGSQDLSLEQGFKIAKQLELTEVETQYFLLMINFARAGEQSLKEYFANELKKIAEQQNDLKQRFAAQDKVNTQLSKENLIIYYSDWVYPAVHIALTIDHLQNTQKLASYLNIPESYVKKVLAQLIEMGLIEVEKNNKNEKYKLGNVRIHLEKDNPILKNFHMQFRQKSLEKIQHNEKNNLNYTSVVSLSHEDFSELKEAFIELIEKYNKKVSTSKEEVVASLTLDFIKW